MPKFAHSPKNLVLATVAVLIALSSQSFCEVQAKGDFGSEAEIPASLPARKEPLTITWLPNVGPACMKPARRFPSQRYRSESLSAAEVHDRHIWSGADKTDEQRLEQILNKQLNLSAEAPETTQYMWETAQYFIAVQKPELAEKLLRELIVTLESHKCTSAQTIILSSATSKLQMLETRKYKVAQSKSPAPTYAPAPRYSRYSMVSTRPKIWGANTSNSSNSNNFNSLPRRNRRIRNYGGTVYYPPAQSVQPATQPLIRRN